MKKTIIIICLLCSFCSAYSPESRIFPNKNEAQYYSASSNFKWIPNLYAFRCGDVNDNYTIGFYSVGFGNNVSADGNYSAAWGDRTWASGEYSTASGYRTHAEGKYSNSWGHVSYATGDYSTSWGRSAATGDYSTAWGYGSSAVGQYSTAWGDSDAIGSYSTAWGAIGTKAVGSFSTVWGTVNDANGNTSTVWGSSNIARGAVSTVYGYDITGGYDSDYCVLLGKVYDYNETSTFAVGYDGIDLTVKHNEINVYDCNIITNGQTGVTADVNVVTDGSVITKLHFVKGIYVGRD
jgi:hypothetical protein